MNLVLNEKEMVKKILEEKFIDKKPTNTIKVLIKHYYSIGMNKEQIKDSLVVFLQASMKGFNAVKWDNLLDALIKNQEKYKYEMIYVDEVHITKNELTTISNIGDMNLEKLAFSYLVYSKIYNKINNNDSNWVNASRKEIFKDSKVTANTTKQRLMVNDLINLGLIESSKRRSSSNKKVLFSDNNSEVEIVIRDFRAFVYEYLRWKGEKIIFCEKCNVLIKPSGKNHKMCRGCWREKQKEWQRESMRKLRQKRKREVF